MISEMDKRAICGAYLMRRPWTENNNKIGQYIRSMEFSNYPDCIQEYNNNSSQPGYDEYLKNLLDYETLISEKSQNRIWDAATEINAGVATEETFNIIINEATNIKENINSGKRYSMQELLSLDLNKTIYKTGLKCFDDIVGEGGFHNERLYVFASKGKGGKSIVLQNLALRLAISSTKSKVLYLSLENNEQDIGSRFLTGFMPQVNCVENLTIIYDPKTTISKVKELSKEFDIIVLDYLSRLIPEKKYDTNYEMLGDFTDQLHYIAADNKKLIISAAQLSRAAISVFKNPGNKSFSECFLEIDQDSMADSINIVRNADVVITTIRDPQGTEQLFNNIASRINTFNDSCSVLYSTQYKLQLDKNKAYFF